MSLPPVLSNRANGACEICTTSTTLLHGYTLPAKSNIIENQVAVCKVCENDIASKQFTNVNHWQCLSGSIWNETYAIRALSYYVLKQLETQVWAKDILDSVEIEEDINEWVTISLHTDKPLIHKDSYGVVLEHGDTIVLTQNLPVKGANFIAPKGTIVRKIKLVHDSEEQIEGKVEGMTIVILTKFVRKSV